MKQQYIIIIKGDCDEKDHYYKFEGTYDEVMAAVRPLVTYEDFEIDTLENFFNNLRNIK